LLSETDAQITSFIPFPDHYTYDRHDLEGLKKQFLPHQADFWITTEKDAMRLIQHPDFLKMIWILQMEMAIERSVPSFENFILDRLKAIVRQGKRTADSTGKNA